MKRSPVIAGFALLLAVGSMTVAQAAVLDLTTDGASDTDGVAVYTQTDPFVTGTGNIDPFVQIGDASPNTGTEVHAYNTNVNGTLDVGSSPNFNEALELTAIPVVNLSGTDYREFLLDINQAKNTNPALLSLDDIQIFQSGTENQSIETFDANGVLELADAELIYRLDDTDLNDVLDDDWIKLNYSLNTGSGSGDMFMYVPDSLFDDSVEFVYLYSHFGGQGGALANNDGFEEWAVFIGNHDPCTPETCPPPPPCEETGECPPPGVVPEPATLLLMGTGLLGLLGTRNRSSLG